MALSDAIMSIVSSIKSSTIVPFVYLGRKEWEISAQNHFTDICNLLYPSALIKNKKNKDDVSTRSHAVADHPIYNFIHNYYQFSPLELRTYSPGLHYNLEGVQSNDFHLIHKFLWPKDYKPNPTDLQSTYVTSPVLTSTATSSTSGPYTLSLPQPGNCLPVKRYGIKSVQRSRDILLASSDRAPHYGCFGLHEWAMLYSGDSVSGIISDKRSVHQAQLSLRVSQRVIDDTVEKSGLSCTHFDAWRFFQPAAQPLNSNNPMSRSSQIEFEQPGCIHATMDLFKYAFQLYPFIPADLLRRCLTVALEARRVDMRASPYDVSHLPGCASPLCIETVEGKLEYMSEQRRLLEMAQPLRQDLINAYTAYLSYLSVSSTTRSIDS